MMKFVPLYGDDFSDEERELIENLPVIGDHMSIPENDLGAESFWYVQGGSGVCTMVMDDLRDTYICIGQLTEEEVMSKLPEFLASPEEMKERLTAVASAVRSLVVDMLRWCVMDEDGVLEYLAESREEADAYVRNYQDVARYTIEHRELTDDEVRDFVVCPRTPSAGGDPN